jgi:hypothetical protein
MHHGTCALVVGILLACIGQPSGANPLVPQETRRDNLLLGLCAGEDRTPQKQQIDLLAEYGFYHLSGRAAECVRRSFGPLVPHLIAAQRPPACPDFSLQEGFREHAGQAATDSMCAALREWFAQEFSDDQILGLWRLGPYVLGCPDALLWVRVAAAEVLADYGDPLARPLVSGLLKATASASSQCPVFSESPAWYLQQAFGRFDGGSAEVVFTRDSDGSYRTYLDPSVVASIEVYRLDEEPASLVMDPRIARDAVLLLRTLALAPSVRDERLRSKDAAMLFDSTTGIRISFRNGLWAALGIMDDDHLSYCDNARLEGNRRVFTSPVARDDLMVLMAHR